MVYNALHCLLTEPLPVYYTCCHKRLSLSHLPLMENKSNYFASLLHFSLGCSAQSDETICRSLKQHTLNSDMCFLVFAESFWET